MDSIEKIKKKIEKYDVISFDIFDTLIRRLVNNPTQIFDIVEKEYNKNHNIPISNFKYNRIMCERKITNVIPNIDNIYNKLSEFYSQETCYWLKNKEIETERKYCVVNLKIKKIYDYCKKMNKRIVAISDMYLSSNVIEDILKENGYEINELIISNEKGCNKASSKLYSFLNVDNKNSVLHIGDSLKADYLGAKNYGFPAIKITKTHYKNINDNYESIISMQDDFNNYYYNLGYQVLGPTLISFVKWLDYEFQKNKINKIYFLAREGKIYKDVFDIIFDKKYETKYLYISRRSITMSNFRYLNFLNLKDILNYFTIKRDSTLSDTLNYLNIKIDNCDNCLNQNIYDLIDDNNLFNKIKEKLIIESKNVNTICLDYLNQEEMNGKFAIVDIGWNGTMQKCLNSFLLNNNIKFELSGYYFSLFKNLENGYQFINKNYKIYETIKNNPVLIENLFQYVDGSTIGYKKDKEKYIPIKKEIEFDLYSQDAIKSIDLGIADFTINWNQYGYCNDYKKFLNKSLSRFENFIVSPTIKDIKMFKKICYSDIKKSEKLIYSGLNIKKGLISSGWKCGYLKSLFKIRINYNSIVKVLKKISGD